ncbi:hypothetical protein V498_01376 [Pseudogymnoascus sp. VKM F-4517 (FW-2822)]|nr:hypothetical protein V498_01376 [Pseudogymnoascus sp. VKM F-4517 (FW-2822)]
MDKPNDLQRLPVEVLDQILALLHADDELVGLSQVCRDMNERVTPLIYSHTIIYLSPHLNLLKADDIEEDLADEGVQMGFGLMRGLANNCRQQCRYVRKLSVRNGYAKESTRGTRWAVAGKGSYFDTTNLSSHSPWVWANIVLGMAIPLMPLLSELVWTAEMPPTEEIFGCLPPGQLKSLVYRFSDDYFYHLKIKWPARFTPGVLGMKNPCLSSLAITDITSWEATNDISSLLVDNRESLKVLKLRFLEEFTRNDKLFDVVSPIIELQRQLRLHTLHLRNVLSPGVPGWLEGFDFTCIRVFVLIEANTLGNTRSKELWSIFQRTDQRFETLITNCENDAFIEFVELTQELERLVLSSIMRPITDFPKLNNHFATLKSLFLPQDAPWKLPLLPVREEHIFAILSEFQYLKHLFFDRYDDMMSVGDARGHTLGPIAFINTFCDFCNNDSIGSAFLSRLELVSYFRTLWSVNSIGQIHTEGESNQLGGIDGSTQRANDFETPEAKVGGKYDYTPVQIGWTDHLDDEMVLALHTWVTNSGWDGPPLPAETNPASWSGRSRHRASKPREETVAHPQHPPLTARGALEFGLGANKPAPFGPPFPTLPLIKPSSNEPRQNVSQLTTMADPTHSESPLATHLPLSNIATQLLQLQTNSGSPATQLALSNIAMQLLQLQTQYSGQEAEQQKKLSALEAKSKLQAQEINTFSSLVSSLLSELHTVRFKQEKLPPSDPAGAKPVNEISRFQSLPDAIQQRIWRYTFPEPRIVQLFGTERVIELAGKIPVAMHICHDSRQAARSVYREINIKQIPCGIDFDNDTLYISTAVRYYSPAGLLSDLMRWFELEDIRRIAFQYELWKIMCDNKEAFSGFLDRLKGLQELIIVIDDIVPATPARRQRHVEFIHCGNSVRESVPALSSKTIPGIDSGFISNPTAESAGSSASSGLPVDESNIIQQLPSQGSPPETGRSKQAAAPSSGSSESPTPESNEGR